MKSMVVVLGVGLLAACARPRGVRPSPIPSSRRRRLTRVFVEQLVDGQGAPDPPFLLQPLDLLDALCR